MTAPPKRREPLRAKGGGSATEQGPSQEPTEAVTTDVGSSATGTWVPLRAAAAQSGVTVAALRRAYREGRIETRETEGPNGSQKLVELGQVRANVGARKKPAGAKTDGAPGTGLIPMADVEQFIGRLDDARREAEAAAVRAAKAETVEGFLREQLAQARAEQERLREELAKAQVELEQVRTTTEQASKSAWWRR